MMPRHGARRQKRTASNTRMGRASGDCSTFGFYWLTYNRPMADMRKEPAPRPASTVPVSQTTPQSDKVLCERCGAEMFRMHAVWRCPSCGYKTDCCGW